MIFEQDDIPRRRMLEKATNLVKVKTLDVRNVTLDAMDSLC